MAHPIIIPDLGPDVTDCTLVDWAKSDGDEVVSGDVICSIETDKVTTGIEADARRISGA